MDEGREHDVELVEAAEDAAEPFQTAEQALDFVAALVDLGVVRPWLGPQRMRGRRTAEYVAAKAARPTELHMIGPVIEALETQQPWNR
ncbi:hypothetical protein GGR23_004535 [Gellertiella hungarica]|uniref:Uncharacterized protein n=1 Tax=Gellertiella hungarica TaxID=1572859 RepID=A0A7W6J9K0_9HYPH|nr:hypothetical protein [Gellertiella hungarica]